MLAQRKQASRKQQDLNFHGEPPKRVSSSRYQAWTPPTLSDTLSISISRFSPRSRMDRTIAGKVPGKAIREGTYSEMGSAATSSCSFCHWRVLDTAVGIRHWRVYVKGFQ
ncbi:hypothetical protein LWI29_000643 [Acer saccharum]|uniref:Uncharacterized protein n=1 Tax=Acer saccharum TaxID=4024 RepID=A0AA39SQM3_ACESA|nr:hypothetical protein LWI29_000643 [Acer saccharum]